MSILSELNLDRSLSRDEYLEGLTRYQVALSELSYQVYNKKRPVVIVFEGWDAAGKGGCIKRLTERLDPRGYTVYPIGAPVGEDKVRHYLYRFWRRLPESGETAIFDRSWYGRVLVERVEEFCTTTEWQRAYHEINEFEHELVQFGTILFKFWLQIGQDEQLRRFEERSMTPYKSWKLTPDDWRNRQKWDDYAVAVEDMLAATNMPETPWTIVEGNDKRWERVKVLKTVAEGLSKELKYTPEILHADLEKAGRKKDKKRRTRSELLAAVETDILAIADEETD